MITKFLTNIDLYGAPYNFTIFNKVKYQAASGGVITIMTVLLYVFCFYFFGRDFYNRDNPHFLNQKITLLDYLKYNLSRDDLFLAFRVEDFDGNPYDLTNFMQIQIKYNSYATVDGEFVLTTRPFDYINCSEINKTAMKLYAKKNTSDMNCLKFDDTPMGGFWDGDFQDYITIGFKPCLNSTMNNNSCIPFDIAYSVLSSGNLSFNIYTTVSYTDISDYIVPLKLNLYNVYANLDPNNGKAMRLFYKTSIITTDTGMISKDITNYLVYALDYVIADTFPVTPPYKIATNTTIIGLFEIYILKNTEVFVVSYIKLQEIIATIGGFLSLISIILNFVAGYFNEHYRSIEVINKLFDFSDIKDEEKMKKLILENKNKKTVKSLFFKKDFKSMNQKIDKNSDNYHKGATVIKFIDEKHEGYLYYNILDNLSIEESKEKGSRFPLKIFDSSLDITNKLYIANAHKVEENNDKLKEINIKDYSQDSIPANQDKKLIASSNINFKNSDIRFTNENKRKSDGKTNFYFIDNITNFNEKVLKSNDNTSPKISFQKSNYSKMSFVDLDLKHIKECAERLEDNSEFLSIGVCLKIKSWLCESRLTEREKFLIKLYRKSQDIINSKMDMINYLKFLQEYNNVKCLQFNDVQSLCLGFTKKPKIYEKNIIIKINSKTYKNLKEIVAFFKYKKRLSEKDNKIYDLLAEDVKNLIKIIKSE